MTEADDPISLLDWRRRIVELYGTVRATADPRAAWDHWRATRDELTASHPQSPLPAEDRASFTGLPYFGYNPAFRVTASIAPVKPERLEIPGSAGETFGAGRFARASFELYGEHRELGCYWLDGYGGGLFVSFRDATSGRETYGACRYLFDTVKGADLGSEGDRLILDFNFAYNPSCSYDPRWACPLAPPDNRLDVEVRAGERAPDHG